jgi:hypothetical protein
VLTTLLSGMYDPTPGNYWFGKKWYYIKTNPTPKCPDRLTENNARFINQVSVPLYYFSALLLMFHQNRPVLLSLPYIFSLIKVFRYGLKLTIRMEHLGLNLPAQNY